MLKLRGKADLSEFKIHNNMDALSPPIRNERSKNLSKFKGLKKGQREGLGSKNI